MSLPSTKEGTKGKAKEKRTKLQPAKVPSIKLYGDKANCARGENRLPIHDDHAFFSTCTKKRAPTLVHYELPRASYQRNCW